jgi:hypothetical protein
MHESRWAGPMDPAQAPKALVVFWAPAWQV